MKKTLFVGLLLGSINANAFLDFNSYAPGYDNNDWPIWTPMYWMEEMFDDNDGNYRNYRYPYPYNNNPYNVGASHFNMNQMPTPDQAHIAENYDFPFPEFTTPAAMSFSNPGAGGALTNNNFELPSPYSMNYNFSEPYSPYPVNYNSAIPYSPYPVNYYPMEPRSPYPGEF